MHGGLNRIEQCLYLAKHKAMPPVDTFKDDSHSEGDMQIYCKQNASIKWN